MKRATLTYDIITIQRASMIALLAITTGRAEAVLAVAGGDGGRDGGEHERHGDWQAPLVHRRDRKNGDGV